MTNDPVSLAAVAIVKDEERCVRRMVESVRDFVDEVLVVDTGSTDQTVATAAAAGARVLRHAWADDFAEARNWALSQTPAAVRFVIDADEWLESGGQELRVFATNHADRVGLVEVRSSSISDGHRQIAATSSERVLPASVRYAGSIHEQPVHSLAVQPTGVILGHDGYESARRPGKTVRNETMLRHALEQSADPYLRYQLGKELQAQERYDEAADSYLGLCGVTDVPWRRALVGRTIAVLGAAGRFAELLDVLDAELATWNDSADVPFAAAGALLDMAAAFPDHAAELLPQIESLWLRCLAIGAQDPSGGEIAARGGHLAAGNLAMLYESVGEPQQALRYREMAAVLQREGR